MLEHVRFDSLECNYIVCELAGNNRVMDDKCFETFYSLICLTSILNHFGFFTTAFSSAQKVSGLLRTFKEIHVVVLSWTSSLDSIILLA